MHINNYQSTLSKYVSFEINHHGKYFSTQYFRNIVVFNKGNGTVTDANAKVIAQAILDGIVQHVSGY